MIKKHGRVYWLDIRIAGRRIRRSLKTDEHALALERAREIKNQLLAGSTRKDVRLEDFARQYMDYAWSHKPASAEREKQRLDKILAFFRELQIDHLADITPYHIEQLRARLRESGLEKSTINRYLQILRGMFYKAIDWEAYQGNNPVKKVKFYREQPQIRPLSTDEVSSVLDAARRIAKAGRSPVQKLFPDLIVFALNTGLRKSEILNLRWKDMKDGEVEVIGKGDRQRRVPLNRTAQEIVGRQPKRTEYIFDIPNRHQHDLFRRTTMQIKKQTGIDFHFHLLRHRFTTALLEKGIDFVTIAELLGHSKITTSLIYSHTSGEKKKMAVDILQGGIS